MHLTICSLHNPLLAAVFVLAVFVLLNWLLRYWWVVLPATAAVALCVSYYLHQHGCFL